MEETIKKKMGLSDKRDNRATAIKEVEQQKKLIEQARARLELEDQLFLQKLQKTTKGRLTGIEKIKIRNMQKQEEVEKPAEAPKEGEQEQVSSILQKETQMTELLKQELARKAAQMMQIPLQRTLTTVEGQQQSSLKAQSSEESKRRKTLFFQQPVAEASKSFLDNLKLADSFMKGFAQKRQINIESRLTTESVRQAD